MPIPKKSGLLLKAPRTSICAIDVSVLYKSVYDTKIMKVHARVYKNGQFDFAVQTGQI